MSGRHTLPSPCLTHCLLKLVYSFSFNPRLSSIASNFYLVCDTSPPRCVPSTEILSTWHVIPCLQGVYQALKYFLLGMRYLASKVCTKRWNTFYLACDTSPPRCVPSAEILSTWYAIPRLQGVYQALKYFLLGMWYLASKVCTKRWNTSYLACDTSPPRYVPSAEILSTWHAIPRLQGVYQALKYFLLGMRYSLSIPQLSFLLVLAALAGNVLSTNFTLSARCSFSHWLHIFPPRDYCITRFTVHEYLKLSMNILLHDVTQNPQVLGTSHST